MSIRHGGVWLVPLRMLLLVVLLLAGCDRPPAATSASPRPSRLVPPDKGAYIGAYVDFGDYEDTVTLEAIEEFDRLVGRRQAVIASSSYWGENSFPTRNMEIVSGYGAVPLLFWSPWDRPYEQNVAQQRFSLFRILAGEHDAYIDMWAARAKAFGKPILVAWGLEMNGFWFPWSGVFHGAGKVIPGTNPPRYEGPETFKKAYRHVVGRVRAAGANNIQWVFHANNDSLPDEPWNLMAHYYPGSDVVDWIGLSAYGQQFPDQGWLTFDAIFPQYYREICAIDPSKPFILAEWGIGEFPKDGNKGAWIREAMRRYATEFPRLKAAVFWHERWQNGDGRYSNLRVNSSSEALDAYRTGAADPFWLDRPRFENAP